MSKTPILAIRHLNKKIGKREILKDISFECYPGEIGRASCRERVSSPV